MAIDTSKLVTEVTLKLTATRDASDPNVVYPNGQLSHLVSITAEGASANALDIFVFQLELRNPYAASSNVYQAYFSNVGSPTDLQELPHGIPTSLTSHKQFLYSQIDVIVRSPTEAQYVWDEVQKDVAALVDQHKWMIAGLVSANPYVKRVTRTIT